MSKLLTVAIVLLGVTGSVLASSADESTTQVSDRIGATTLATKQAWFRDAIDGLLSGSDRPAVPSPRHQN